MTKKTQSISEKDFFSTIEDFLKKRERLLFGFAFFLTIIFALLLFDLKINVGGDDSAYIIRALDFIRNGTFPSFQGPLYPIFLCPVVAVFDKCSPVKVPLFFSRSRVLFFVLQGTEKQGPTPHFNSRPVYTFDKFIPSVLCRSNIQ